jgi:hypothetical protein
MFYRCEECKAKVKTYNALIGKIKLDKCCQVLKPI